MSSNLNKIAPIEVWLRLDPEDHYGRITCTIVNEDETDRTLPIDSHSMRGAQREMTGYLLGEGYQAIGRWETTATVSDGYAGQDPTESVRRFKPVEPPNNDVEAFVQAVRLMQSAPNKDAHAKAKALVTAFAARMSDEEFTKAIAEEGVL